MSGTIGLNLASYCSGTDPGGGGGGGGGGGEVTTVVSPVCLLIFSTINHMEALIDHASL